MASAPQPTISVDVEPNDPMDIGDLTVSWTTQGATAVHIDPGGAHFADSTAPQDFGPNGSGRYCVGAEDEATITITATGPGGTANWSGGFRGAEY